MVVLHLEEEVCTYCLVYHVFVCSVTSQVLTLQRVRTGFTIGVSL